MSTSEQIAVRVRATSTKGKSASSNVRPIFTVEVDAPMSALVEKRNQKLRLTTEQIESVLSDMRSKLKAFDFFDLDRGFLNEPRKPGTAEMVRTRVVPKARAADSRATLLHDRAVAMVKAGTTWLTGEQVGNREGGNTKNPYALASRWSRDGKIFSVKLDGVNMFPAYAFEPTGSPIPALRDVLRVLDGMSPFAIASWFESTSSTLGGKRPRELLAVNATAVVAAAVALREGVSHG